MTRPVPVPPRRKAAPARPPRKAETAEPEAGGAPKPARRPRTPPAPVTPEPPPARRSPAHDQLNNRIFFRLFQLGNELQRQAVQQLGITTVQWAVLGALSQDRFADGIPLSVLCDYLVVSRQNLDGVLKRLERDGLVRRVPGLADRRARIVQLTPQGRAFWADIQERIYRFYDRAASRFSFDERVALVHYLNELRRDLAQVTLP